MRRSLLSFVFVCLAIAAPAAYAHRGHHTLSVVEIAADGQVTVTHTLSAHDTEPELVALAPQAQPSLDDPDALAALETHLATAFQVNDLALSRVSTELAGDDVVVVFRGKLTGPADQVRIGFHLFPDSEFRPVGLVNIRSAGVTRSLNFQPGDTDKTADLGP